MRTGVNGAGRSRPQKQRYCIEDNGMTWPVVTGLLQSRSAAVTRPHLLSPLWFKKYVSFRLHYVVNNRSVFINSFLRYYSVLFLDFWLQHFLCVSNPVGIWVIAETSLYSQSCLRARHWAGPGLCRRWRLLRRISAISVDLH